MKLFNFTLGGNATTPNIEEESVMLREFVCVCYVCVKQYLCVCVFNFIFFLKKNLKQCVKKNQPKKIMH